MAPAQTPWVHLPATWQSTPVAQAEPSSALSWTQPLTLSQASTVQASPSSQLIALPPAQRPSLQAESVAGPPTQGELGQPVLPGFSM